MVLNSRANLLRNGPQANNITTSSFAATCLEELPELSKDGVDEEAIRAVGGTIYLGERHHRVLAFHELDVVTRWRRDGRLVATTSVRLFADRLASKTASTIKSFFLAATLHPEVVKLAQKELDEVTGGDRLPDFSDLPQLPYISAISKEVLRWRPPTPISKGSLSDFVVVN